MKTTDYAFRARTDRRYIRPNGHSERFVLVDITAPPAPKDTPRPPVNLAFVLDRSGSMSGDKIRLARAAVEASLARLHPTDRFALVTYDDQIDVVWPGSPATAEARQAALARLAEIDARGSTDLGGGWLRGCEQVANAMSADGVNRCLLLTDGLANVGITDGNELTKHATELLARGVSTTTFGVGADFDEVLLSAMATAGGGNFYYISSAAQIADYVTSEVGEALEVVAREVAVELTTREDVAVESLTPYPVERRGARTIVRLGALVSEQVSQVVLRLKFPTGEAGGEVGAIVALTDRDGVFSGAGAQLAWEYAADAVVDSQPRDIDVDRAVARVFAARAMQEATALNRQGNFPAAQVAMLAVAKRIKRYGGSDSEMGKIVAQLEAESSTLAAPMSAPAAKAMQFASYASLRSRSPQGKANRR